MNKKLFGFELVDEAKKKILILDGAMGTMIQNEGLSESDFRGKEFKNHDVPLKGNNDFLNLTKPEIISKIHLNYLEAGADIIETNTFNSNQTSQSDYNCESLSYRLNYEGAKLAKNAVTKYNKKNNKKIFVAGVLGPTNRTCSMSPDVNRPEYRNINFETLKKDYMISIKALLEGGSDLIFIETIFDTLNAKSAMMAVYEVEKELKIKIPLMLSATITDLSGRTLSGQTLEAFYNSVLHVKPISVGINCALGPKELDSHLKELSRFSDFLVSIHSNAGLPNAFGGYDETPEKMAEFAGRWSKDSHLNIIGGCCGTTPEHILAIKNAVEKFRPRKLRKIKHSFKLSGLEPFNID